ncbi:hypothetical protein LP414_19565 [Polaromonas sp. P1(28)-13]|nr:hypothetical protein LP414_19565 [Polaromonas sp. P1(28)-13]
MICDAIKHPAPQLTVHIAHKREAVTDFKTSSEERIVEIHDIRTIDLELELSKTKEDFELLAAELFLLRLHQASGRFNCPEFKPEWLHDSKYLENRLSKSYRDAVVGCVRKILPFSNAPEIAQQVIENDPLRRRLKDMLEKGLALQKLKDVVPAETLISSTYPSASIVLGALLNRKTQVGQDVIAQYHKSIKRGPATDDPFSSREDGLIIIFMAASFTFMRAYRADRTFFLRVLNASASLLTRTSASFKSYVTSPCCWLFSDGRRKASMIS